MSAPRVSARALALAVGVVTLAAGLITLAVGRRPPSDAPVDTDAQARLRALGYLGWHEEEPDSLARGSVTRHDEARAVPGLNLYCSEPSGMLRFVAMDGTELHTIDLGMDEAADPGDYCKVAVPHGDDALVVVLAHTKLVRVGLDGTVHWALHRAFHHDVHVTRDGRIVAVASLQKKAPAAYPATRPLTDDVIVVLDDDGAFLQTFSMAALVAHEPALLARARAHLENPYPYWPAAAAATPPAKAAVRREWRRHDPFHVNTVAVLPDPLPLPDGREAPAGAILFCARNLDSVGIIDPTSERIIWHWGIGELQWPHHPSLVAGGRLLLFDNGVARGASRLLELDPAHDAVTWRYEAGPAFFSRSRGSAQRLPGGHTLVTESSRGRVFEIDPAGEIVWEFLNPERLPEKQARATIFRMTRLMPERVTTMRWPDAARARLAASGLRATASDDR